jgi:hypothetical protein
MAGQHYFQGVLAPFLGSSGGVFWKIQELLVDKRAFLSILYMTIQVCNHTLQGEKAV